MDRSLDIPKDVGGLSLKDIANDNTIKYLYPDLDESGRLALVQESFDKHHIDTAFRFGHTPHAMATVLQRSIGNKYNGSDGYQVLKDFYAYSKHVPIDDLKLRAAQIMAIEKGWPTIKNASPEAVESEMIASFEDDAITKFTTPSILFVESDVAISELKKMTGLSEGQLAKVVPVTSSDDTKTEKTNSILNLFMDRLEFKPYSHLYNIYLDETGPVSMDAEEYSSDDATGPVLRIHYADNAKADLTPSVIMDDAKIRFRWQLASDPWVEAMARTKAREAARKNGNLPSDEIEQEKKAVAMQIGPITARERAADDLRNKLHYMPGVGEQANLIMLGRDWMDVNYEAIVDHIPYLWRMTSGVKTVSDLIHGNTDEGIERALQNIPRIEIAYAWLSEPEKPVDMNPKGAVLDPYGRHPEDAEAAWEQFRGRIPPSKEDAQSNDDLPADAPTSTATSALEPANLMMALGPILLAGARRL